MSRVAGPGGSGGAGGAVTLDMIRSIRPESLRNAASSLTSGSTKLDGQHGNLVGQVQNPLLAGVDWSGVGQPQAGGKVQRHASQVTGVGQRLSPAATVLNGLADYLDSAKSQVHKLDSTASDLHVSVGSGGETTVHHVPGEGPSQHKQRSGQADQLQGLAQSVITVTAKVDGKAAGALNALQQGDPTKPPPKDLIDAEFWKQNFQKLVVPPLAMGPGGVALWAAGWGLRAHQAISDWSARVRHGTFAPRSAKTGRYVSKNAPWYKNAYRRTRARNWRANPYQSASRARWLKAAKWGGRAGGVISVATAGLDQWLRDSGRTDLSTAERVGRTANRAVLAGGGAWAGAAAGAAIGSVIPGVGTVVGGVIGGIIGGVAGSSLGNWVADHTVDWAGHAAEGVKDAAVNTWHALTPW